MPNSTESELNEDQAAPSGTDSDAAEPVRPGRGQTRTEQLQTEMVDQRFLPICLHYRTLPSRMQSMSLIL